MFACVTTRCLRSIQGYGSGNQTLPTCQILKNCKFFLLSQYNKFFSGYDMKPEEGIPTWIHFTSFIVSISFLVLHDIFGLLLYIFKHLYVKDTKLGHALSNKRSYYFLMNSSAKRLKQFLFLIWKILMGLWLDLVKSYMYD